MSCKSEIKNTHPCLDTSSSPLHRRCESVQPQPWPIPALFVSKDASKLPKAFAPFIGNETHPGIARKPGTACNIRSSSIVLLAPPSCSSLLSTRELFTTGARALMSRERAPRLQSGGLHALACRCLECLYSCTSCVSGLSSGTPRRTSRGALPGDRSRRVARHARSMLHSFLLCTFCSRSDVSDRVFMLSFVVIRGFDLLLLFRHRTNAETNCPRCFPR